jgi:hypothetical protein
VLLAAVILILTAPDDDGSDRVEGLLRERGHDVVRFDPAELGAGSSLSITYLQDRGWQRRVVRADGAVLDLERVTAAWVRRPGPPCSVHPEPAMRAYIVDEWRDAIADLWTGLPCAWIPARPPIIQLVQRKSQQLIAATAVGFAIPETAFTSAAEDFYALHQRHDGEIVTKLASATAFIRHFGASAVRFTESAADDGVAALAMRHAPLVVQQKIAKRVELRVTVVGDRVFAAELHSQQRSHTRDDWRRYDPQRMSVLPHELPARVGEQCVELTRRLGLCYSALDLIVTPGGDHVFLEINPSGQFGWIEEATGLPISEAICDLLTCGDA